MPITFRCYHCNKTLRATRRQPGTIVKCPKCKVELIVPDAPPGAMAEDREAHPVPDPGGPQAGPPGALADLLEIDPADIRVEPGSASVLLSSPPPPRVEAARPVEEVPAIVAIDVGRRKTPVATPGAGPDDNEGDFPEIQLEPQPIRPLKTRSLVDRSYQARPRDVSLPRAAVVAWSLFLPLSLILAFAAGLLAGHFLWVVRVVPSP